MPKTAAIDFHHALLLRLLAGLFAVAGVAVGESVARLPVAVQLRILRVLQPAESALRRLIFMLALEMEMAEYKPRPAPKAKIERGDGSSGRIPPFGLFDPRKSFPELTPDKRRTKRGRGPNIYFFDGSDTPPQPEPEKPVRDPDDAARLSARMLAMQKALDDMPKQARRLLRAMAKRAKAPAGPKRYGPLRPGLPPGYRERWTHEVDEVLYECDQMARRAEQPPDTS